MSENQTKPVSNLERMRQVAANKPKPAALTKPGNPNNPSPLNPTGKELKLVDVVVHKCGCVVPAGMFRNQHCYQCTATKRKKNKEKGKGRKKFPPVLSAHQDLGGPAPGRLPVGTRKDLTFGDDLKCSGTMIVPGCPVVFTAKEGSEQRACFALHNQYVKWLTDQRATGNPVPCDKKK